MKQRQVINKNIGYCVARAKHWIDEAYKYGFDLKASRRCLENAKSHLYYAIENMKSIEDDADISDLDIEIMDLDEL